MGAVFVPQFFLVIGIDVFLVGSILTTLLEQYYSNAFPFVYDIGALIGFAQLWSGPGFLSSFGEVLQFYYCAGYALIAVMSVLGSNLHLAVIKKKRLPLSAVFAMTATIPSSLVLLYFVSAYVNGIPVALPYAPVLSWTTIYILLLISAIVLIVMILAEYALARLTSHSKKPT